MFNFNLTVSDQGFETKPTDYTKITFTEQNVTISEMRDLIEEGRLFAGCFNDISFHIKEKTKDNFVSTQVIPIDIDDCDCSMMDYLPSLKYMPTFAYETFSNLQEGKGFRFRLLYVFKDSVVGGDNYTLLWNAICRANNINDFNDSSTGTCNQGYFGTCKDRVVVSVGPVYDSLKFSSFIDESVLNQSLIKRRTKSNKQLEQDTFKLNDETFKEYWEKRTDMDILTHMRHYQTNECTQIDWEDGELWRNLEDTHYYQIKRKWEMRLAFNGGRYKSIPVNRRLMNGQHRRNKIFISLVRRRLIDPTITIEHLCYAALYELYFFIDNTDKADYITRHQLAQIANSAYNTDLERYREKLRENKKFKVNKMEASRQGLTTRQAVAKANSERIAQKKEKEYAELSKKYEQSLSVRKNAELLGISKTKAQSLKKWIDKKTTGEQETTSTDKLSTNEGTTQPDACKCPKIQSKQYPTLEEETNGDMAREHKIINIYAYEKVSKSNGNKERIEKHDLSGILANGALEKGFSTSKRKGAFQMSSVWQ